MAFTSHEIDIPFAESLTVPTKYHAQLCSAKLYRGITASNRQHMSQRECTAPGIGIADLINDRRADNQSSRIWARPFGSAPSTGANNLEVQLLNG